MMVNYEDSPTTILNLKRALLYCNKLHQQLSITLVNVIEITAELMNRYDFCCQIADQQLLETILITSNINIAQR